MFGKHVVDRIGGSLVSSAKRALWKLIGLSVEPSESTERRQTSSDPSSDNPWFRTQGQPPTPAPRAGAVSAERELWPTVRRLLLTGLVGLLLVVGAWSVFVRPFINRTTDTDPAASADVSVASAQAAASRFSLDYLSYSPANDPALRAAALAGRHQGLMSQPWRGPAPATSPRPTQCQARSCSTPAAAPW